MGVIEFATSPWGENVPIHIAFDLIWVAAIGGLAFLIAHAITETVPLALAGIWTGSVRTSSSPR